MAAKGANSFGPACSLSRRRFLGELGKLAVTAPAILAGVKGVRPGTSAKRQNQWVESSHYVKLPGNRIQCFVCPVNCVLSSGETCPCRTRTNHGGTLYNHAYDNPCVLSVDPIEKLPMYHFRPGMQALSLAIAGCNLRCQYCQNWEISQKPPELTENLDLDASGAIAAARQKDCQAVCFTYTEPVVFSEWVRDVGSRARSSRLRVAAATAGYVNPEPLKELCKVVDAFAITLKAFNEQFYREVCQAQLKPVLTSLETIKKAGSWLEVVNLIVPTRNDNMDEIREMCRWIRKTLGPDTPLHFERFVPEFQMRNLPRTPLETIEEARKTGLAEGLKHVYASNVAPHIGNNTFCPKCGMDVIKRVGFRILENSASQGKCRFCGTVIAGVWA